MQTNPSPVTISTSVQTNHSPVTIRTSIQVPELASTEIRLETVQRLSEVAQQVGLSLDVDTLSTFVSSGSVSLQCSGCCTIHDSSCSWQQYYPVLSFLLNGHLHVDYVRLSGWLGLPPCSSTHWHRIVQKQEIHVTKLAEWSCGQVQKNVMNRGDDKQWVASYDGFYLTQGHYSNNSSATLHDYESGAIAWFVRLVLS